MLTCKVGETIINCFDGEFDKYKLKLWSDKKKLVCPDCGKLYEYCHGEIKSPYFRHKEKNKDCDSIYSEPETEEHIKGKLILYNWLMKMQEEGTIKNLKLESYISSTKQRPDIYFEKNDEQYVIEFQCTPIATEYLERHELYKLANINDIWILGLDKYNIESENENIKHSIHFKAIEKHTDMYLNVKNENIYIGNKLIKQHLPYDVLRLKDFYTYLINEFELNVNHKTIFLNNHVIELFIEKDNNEYERIKKKNEMKKYLDLTLKEIAEELNSYFGSIDDGCVFYYIQNNYFPSIRFYNSQNEFTFFIKDDCIDCCIEYEKSVAFRGKRGGLGWRKETRYRNIDTLECDIIDKDVIVSYVKNTINNIIQDHKDKIEAEEKKYQEKTEKKMQQFYDLLEVFLDKDIYLINAGREKISEDIRFKFLKGFRVTDEYMRDTFTNELKFLKNRKADKYVFMIPKYHNHFNSLGFSNYVKVGDFNEKIIKYFESFGFKNVRYLNESEANI